jgi:hypothetical protein
MAQVHDIDGTTVNYISQALWDQPVNDQSLDLIAVHNSYRRHTWVSNVMTAAEWSTMRGKRGSVVSITTTNPNDPNGDYVTYYDAVVRNVTQGNHESLNFQGVRIEFLINVA